MICEFAKDCRIYKEYKSTKKHKISYTLYCIGRKRTTCARRDLYLDEQTPIKSLLPSGIYK